MGDLTLYDLVCLRSFVKENIGFFHNKLSYSEVTNDEFSIKFYKQLSVVLIVVDNCIRKIYIFKFIILLV